MRRIEVIGIEGLAEVRQGDSVAKIIIEGCSRLGLSLISEDILVVAHKIVSKAEGRTIPLDEVKPSAKALELAKQLGKEAPLLEVILGESRRIIRMGGGTIIVETHHGFICANAGVDLSNAGLGQAVLLPQDPDRSAREIREQIRQLIGAAPAIIISDSFGRPWRLGAVDVAVGVSGIKSLKDDRGKKDFHGYELRASLAAVTDELASAAELVMGKRDGIPVALIRGYTTGRGEGSAKELLRPEAEDLFRNF